MSGGAAIDGTVLDVRGQLCPIPVIRTQSRIADLESGAILEIICTDPGAREDIPAWCRIHGHEVIAIDEAGDREIRIRIRVGEAD